MTIIVSLFHIATTETLCLLDDSLEVSEKIKSSESTNAKGIAIYMDKVIVAQKDNRNECYLLVYSKENFILLNKVHIKETKDVHSIYISGSEVIAVSTGTNEIHYYDFRSILKDNEACPRKKVNTLMTLNTAADVIHLNGLSSYKNHMFISGFGAVKPDSRWSEAKDGFILDIDSGEFINKEPLLHPHSIFIQDTDIYYCESRKGIIYKNNRAIIKINGGYPRGLAVSSDSKEIYVGVSSRFYKEVKVSSTKPEVFKYELDSENEYQASKRISLGEPGSEIYDIVLLS